MMTVLANCFALFILLYIFTQISHNNLTIHYTYDAIGFDMSRHFSNKASKSGMSKKKKKENTNGKHFRFVR